MKTDTHITPDLAEAVDKSVLQAMRIETPGLITVLETLIRIGENDATILARCQENSPTAETMRNITHALAALRKTESRSPAPWELACTLGGGSPGAQVACRSKDGTYSVMSAFGPGCHVVAEVRGLPNARIVAASPMLLQLLTRLCEYWDNGTPVHANALIVEEVRSWINSATKGYEP